MKKFLAILLIAIVACEAVEEFNLKGWLDGIIEQLKKWGIYDALISKGKEFAINLCANYLDRSLCEMAVNWLCSQLGI